MKHISNPEGMLTLARVTADMARLGFADRPAERERAYEQARTQLPRKSPDAADTARGTTHKETTP